MVLCAFILMHLINAGLRAFKGRGGGVNRVSSPRTCSKAMTSQPVPVPSGLFPSVGLADTGATCKSHWPKGRSRALHGPNYRDFCVGSIYFPLCISPLSLRGCRVWAVTHSCVCCHPLFYLYSLLHTTYTSAILSALPPVSSTPVLPDFTHP